MSTNGLNNEYQAAAEQLKAEFTAVGAEVLGNVAQRVQDQFHMHMKDWIMNRRVSETLRRNYLLAQQAKGEGKAEEAYGCHPQYQHERAAAVYGYGFDVTCLSKLHRGKVISEGDSDAHVQLGLFTHGLKQRDIFGDRYIPCHMVVEDMWGNKKTGIGIVIEHKHQPCWVRRNQVVYALVAEICPKTKTFLPVCNPC